MPDTGFSLFVQVEAYRDAENYPLSRNRNLVSLLDEDTASVHSWKVLHLCEGGGGSLSSSLS